MKNRREIVKEKFEATSTVQPVFLYTQWRDPIEGRG